MTVVSAFEIRWTQPAASTPLAVKNPSGERPGLWFRQLGYAPAASERLHQQHAGVHATAEDVDLVALVRQGHGLGGDNLKIVVDPAPVAVSEELQRQLRRLDGAPLLLGLLLEDPQSRQVVFDLLEGRQRGLAVSGHRCVVASASRVRGGTPAPAVERSEEHTSEL